MKRGTNLDKERFLQKVEISSNVFLIIGIFVVFGLLAFMLYDLSITGNIILDSENTNLGTNLTNTNSTTTNFTNTNSTINNSTINNSTTTNLTGALMSNESLEVDSGIGIDFPKITGDVIAAEEVKENTVEELTVIEYFVSSFEMDVIVYMPYELRNEDILAFANLSSLVFINETDTINLFWINADSRELTEFTAIDSNKDFVIDYIEWVVPYSPNQTYEIIIDHEICDNSVDDDSDSLVDCLDKDCDEDISCLVVCDLTDAFWNLTSVDEGTTVDLILFANESCNGKFVNFEIFEDDGIFPDDFMDVNLYPIEIVDGRAVISWETEYEDDSFLRISRNPEYYFVATLVDDGDIDITSSGGLLEVTEIGISEGEICGNGIIEDGEACDDGNNVSGADGCYWNCQLQPGYDCIGEIGELSSCSFMGEECGFGQDSEVIMVWAYPNGATVSGNTNIGIVAYHQNGIKNITFYVDDVLADTVMTETINPDTNEYEYVFVMDTTEYADDTSYNITATGYPNCGLSVALFEELMVQVDNSPTYNIIYVDAINGDDANPGTTTQPVKTIKEGLNLAESGDTIKLRNGYYTFNTSDVVSVFTKYTTITPDDGHNPIINETDVWKSDFVKLKDLTVNFTGNPAEKMLYGWGADYLWIDNVTLIGGSTFKNLHYGVHFWGKTHNTIAENSKLVNLGKNIALPSGGIVIARNNEIGPFYGDAFNYFNNTLISHNVIHDALQMHVYIDSKNNESFDVSVDNDFSVYHMDYVPGADYVRYNFSDIGALAVDNTAATAQEIVNSLNQEFDAAGIALGLNATVEDGKIRITVKAGASHVQHLYVEGGANNAFGFVEEGISKEASGTGFHKDVFQTWDFSENSIIRNNNAYGNDAQGWLQNWVNNMAFINNILDHKVDGWLVQFRGNYVYNNILMEHNTIVTDYSPVTFDDDPTKNTNFVVRNNIFGFGSGIGERIGEPNYLMDYNVFDLNGANNLILNNNSIDSNLGNFRPSETPLFVDMDYVYDSDNDIYDYYGDFHLALNSVAIDFGTNKSGIFYDMEWTQRDNFPDAGAYEFGSSCSISSDCPVFTCKDAICTSGKCEWNNAAEKSSCSGEDDYSCTGSEQCFSGVCLGTVFDDSVCEDPMCTGESCSVDGCDSGSCQTDLLLWLKMEDNVLDSGYSGNDYDITRNGVEEYEEGIVGRGARFGLTSDSYIEVDDLDTFENLEELTVSFWAKRLGFSADATVINKQVSFNFGIPSNGINGYVFNESGNRMNFEGIVDVSNTNWHHYALSYNGSSLVIYFDSVEVARENMAGKTDSSATKFTIGGHQWDDSFNGTMDEVRIYSRGLNSSEILEIYEGDLCGNSIIESWEECDDGNTASLDGCSSVCLNEGVVACSENFANNISQYNITWTFDKCYEYGTFVNGDYWVVPDTPEGNVTITNITPNFTPEIISTVTSCSNDDQCDEYSSLYHNACNAGTCEYQRYHHGWDVNPTNINTVSYDSRISFFNISMQRTFPYNATVNSSIVKTVSKEIDNLDPRCTHNSIHNCKLSTAAVLTILDSVPPENSFRPGYFGNTKKIYKFDDVNTNLLPSYDSVPAAKSINEIMPYFERVYLDHIYEWMGRIIHPDLNLWDYGAEISIQTSIGAQTLMLNASLEEKTPLLINYLQTGLDLWSIYNNGGGWVSNGGHSVGRKLPLTFTGVMFNDSEILNAINSSQLYDFQENSDVYYAANAQKYLYGQPNEQEVVYWEKLIFGCDGIAGSKTILDPYKWIDGGCQPGLVYALIALATWKSNSISMYMMPELAEHWSYKDNLLKYTDRRMNNGLWTQPDPCAPIMGRCIGGSDDLEICTFANLSTCETEICGGGICAIGSQFEGNVCKDLNDCGLNGICEKNPEFWQITYGPDPANPGECINDLDATDGIGRYPALHAEYKGYHSYGTTLTNELWDEYRYSYCSNGVQDFDEEEIDCGGQCERDVDGDYYYGWMCDTDDVNYDCDDNNADINPDATEICTKSEEFDDNCDGVMHDSYYTDGDLDGVNDCEDNCPLDCNADQSDRDYDSIGDACDADFSFYEDFEIRDNISQEINGGISFENITGSAGLETSTHWEYYDRHLRINAGEPEKLIISSKGRNEWTNYTLNLIAGHKYTYSGIVVNYKDSLNYYIIKLSGNGGNLEKIENGVTNTIIGTGNNTQLAWGGVDANYSIDVSYDENLNIQIIKNGTHIRNFVDSIPHSTNGSIGFSVPESGSGNYFIADNMSLLFENDYAGETGVCSNNPVCGNNITESGEQCDDGNTISGDDCSSSCMNEAGGNTYYVSKDDLNCDNNNPGTSQQPWCSITRALANYNDPIKVEFGDTVKIRDGNYGYLEIRYATPAATSWDDKITYIADDGHEPVIENLYLVNNRLYLEFNNINFRPKNGTTAIEVATAKNLRFINLDVAGVWNTNYSSIVGNDSSGFDSLSSGYNFRAGAVDNLMDDITIENNEIYNLQRGIQIACYIGSKNGEWVIKNNHVYNTSNSQVKVQALNSGSNGHVLVENNHIHDYYSFFTGYDMSHASGIAIKATNVTIRNNTIHATGSTAGIGVYSNSGEPGVGYSDILIENNLVYDNANQYAVRLWDVSDNGSVIFRNNTIIGWHDTGSGATYYYSVVHIRPYGWYETIPSGPANCSGLEIYNNIIVGVVIFDEHQSDLDGLNDYYENYNYIYSVNDYGGAGFLASHDNTIIATTSGFNDVFENDFFINSNYSAAMHRLNLNEGYRPLMSSPVCVDGTAWAGALPCVEYGVASACNLDSANWSTLNATEGEVITLSVNGSNCAGEEVSFEVYEDDLFGTDENVSVHPVNVSFIGNSATQTWVTEYQPDGLLGIGDPPEYYFIATLVSDGSVSVTSSGGLLEVSEGVGEISLPKAIARWDVVPFQTFNDTFEVGVVAFHKDEIARVEFNYTTIAGAQSVSVNEMTLNPRTNVYEYWITLDADDFNDGLIEVVATAYPIIGTPLVLQGELEPAKLNGYHSLFLNANSLGTLSEPIVWVDSVNGNDTTGDGSSGLPFATMYFALQDVFTNYGSADGARVYLSAGDYEYARPNGAFTPDTTNRWVTIMPAPGVSRENVKIISPVGSANSGMYTKLVNLYNITLMAPLLTSTNLEDYLWIDNVYLNGGGPNDPLAYWSSAWWTGVYATDSTIFNTTNGFTTVSLARNVVADEISNDAFPGALFVINSRVSAINPHGTVNHNDVWQERTPGTEDNVIVYGLYLDDSSPVQGFLSRTLEHNNIAFVNNYLHLGGYPNQNQWRTLTDHFVFKHNTFTGTSFYIVFSDTALGVSGFYGSTNVKISNNVFQWINIGDPEAVSGSTSPVCEDTGIDFINNHYINLWPAYAGDPNKTPFGAQSCGTNFTEGLVIPGDRGYYGLGAPPWQGSSSACTNNISQYNITWTFDKCYEYGTFVNGDYWVVGPVNITKIDPATIEINDSYRHGSMVNPVAGDDVQAYDGRADKFDETKVVSFPYILQQSESLISTRSVSEDWSPTQSRPRRGRLMDAAVLTSLSVTPLEGSFRPPYSGNNKTIKFNKNQLDYSSLLELDPVASTHRLKQQPGDEQFNDYNILMPSTSVERAFERVWLDHIAGPSQQGIHPYNNLPDYSATMSELVGMAALMLNLNFSGEDDFGDYGSNDVYKETLVIRLAQVGIDHFGIVQTGGEGHRSGNGGHNSGNKWPILFAGIMLDDVDMKSIGNVSGDYLYTDGYGPGNPPPGYVNFAEDDQTFYITSDDVYTQPYSLNNHYGIFYEIGNVKVTQGSAIVEGVGTTWNISSEILNSINDPLRDPFFGVVNDSEAYSPEGKPYHILSIDSGTQLTLKSPYRGDTDLTGTVQYKIASEFFYGHGAGSKVYQFNNTKYDYVEYTEDDIGLAEWGIAHYSTTIQDGKNWDAVYRQCCTNRFRAGYVLGAIFMDAKELWNHDALFDYQSRYMEVTKEATEPGVISEYRQVDIFTEEMWDTYSGYVVCSNDSECNDGLFCNGVETCVAQACVAGVSPDDDNVSCTVDTCNEKMDSIANIPSDVLCDDKLSCTKDVCTGNACINTAIPDCVSSPGEDSLILHLPFDSDGSNDTYANDISGDENDGAVVGAVHNSIGGPYGSGAYEFNGNSDYIDLGSGDEFNFSKFDGFTISAWVNSKDVVQSQQTIFARGGIHTGSSSTAVDFRYSTTAPRPIIKISNGTVNIQASFGSNQWSTNEWHFIVARWDGTNLSLCMNVTNCVSISDSGFGKIHDAPTTRYTSIGAGTRVLGKYFNGSIDDVRVYAQVLSDEEVSELYDSYLSECGNSVVETGEQCDDGNTISGDDCSSSCMNEASACIDKDLDGFNQSLAGCGEADCNDFNMRINPGAVEVCNCIDNNCNNISDDSCIPPKIIKEGLDGATMNFSGLNNTDWCSIKDVCLERSTEGKVCFRENLPIEFDMNFTKIMKTRKNRLEIDSYNYSSFNKSARIWLYNVTYTNPVILRDGVLCGDYCSNLTFENGVASFDVSSFSSYEVIGCGDDICNGGEDCSTCSDDCGVCSATGGGGGGGGGGTSVSAEIATNDSIISNILENQVVEEIGRIVEDIFKSPHYEEDDVAEDSEGSRRYRSILGWIVIFIIFIFAIILFFIMRRVLYYWREKRK